MELFTQKVVTLKNMSLGSGIRNKPIPDPGSRGQKGTQSPIPDPDPQHWFAVTFKIATKNFLLITFISHIYIIFQK